MHAGQVAFFSGWALAVALWLYARVLRAVAPPAKPAEGDVEGDPSPSSSLTSAARSKTPVGSPLPLVAAKNPLTQALMLDRDTLVENHDLLQAMAEFGVHMLYFLVCDREPFEDAITMPHPLEKVYSRDVFFFIYLIFVAYSLTTLTKTAAPVYLNRDQTEEWKGWMQVLFLLYHYFNATEQYNSIRVYIAAYVWMTGFGNFSFYYVRRDFSPARFFQMLWRLNFLVFFVCVVMGNEYMLYYICPMHTLWTIVVYVVLLVGNEYNENQVVIAGKFAACMVFGVALWWSEDVFTSVWWPVRALFGFTPPNVKEGHNVLYEWYFRGGLDRYVYVFGMLCANLHPNTERVLKTIDDLPVAACYAVRGVIAAVTLGMFYYWVVTYFALGKYEYNASHPYTSWIPILVYIVLRNLTPTLRAWHMHFMGWLGKITLETYIAQFHIWLHTHGENRSPKLLLNLVGGDNGTDRTGKYALLNFALVTAVYIFVSYRLFHLTADMKSALLPSKNEPAIYRNLVLIAAGWCALYVFGSAVAPILSAMPAAA